MSSPQELSEQIAQSSQWVEPINNEISRVVIGQQALVHGLLIGLLTNGHILLEGVPGVAKTLTVKTLAACIHTQFQRIQFTPDLLPADLIGTLVYNPRTGEFSTNVTKLCDWCDYKEWCPAHGGELARAREEGTARVNVRRREAGLPVAP